MMSGGGLRPAVVQLVVPVVLLGHQIGLDDHADIGGVELVVDHRPVADVGTEP